MFDFATEETTKIDAGPNIVRADLHSNGVITVVKYSQRTATLSIYRRFEVVNQIELGALLPTAVLAFDDYVCVGLDSNQVMVCKRSKDNKC